MIFSKSGRVLAAALLLAGTTSTASACGNAWSDVTILCPYPAPWTGPKTLTPTSRHMPTVGTPGTYRNWGNGYDVKVYLHGNDTGYQPFHWQKAED